MPPPAHRLRCTVAFFHVHMPLACLTLWCDAWADIRACHYTTLHRDGGGAAALNSNVAWRTGGRDAGGGGRTR